MEAQPPPQDGAAQQPEQGGLPPDQGQPPPPLPPQNQGQNEVLPPPGGVQQQGGPLPGQVGFNIPINPPQAQAFYLALIRLGLSPVAVQEFINNGITSLNKLRSLSAEALDMLIKQITKQRDAPAANPGAGIFIPFFSQQYICAI